MIPIIVGAVVAAGAVYALSGDDDKKNESETLNRKLSESELPPAIRKKLDDNRNRPNQ